MGWVAWSLRMSPEAAWDPSTTAALARQPRAFSVLGLAQGSAAPVSWSRRVRVTLVR